MSVEKNRAYGIIQGYEVNAELCNMEIYFPLKIYISFHADESVKNKIAWEIKGANIKNSSVNFVAFGICIGLNDFTVARLVKRLGSILDKVMDIIRKNGALGKEYCPECGQPMAYAEVKQCDIDGIKVNMDTGCVNKINADIAKENAEFASAPDNYFKGFLGALIGGIVGGIFSVILYFIGFIAAISTVMAIALGTKLYMRFGGKANKKMVAIVIVTSLICMLLSVLITYIIAAGIAARQAGSSMSAAEAFAYCMKDKQFSTYFYADLALAFFFSALGIVAEIFYLMKKVKRRNSIG